MIAIQTYSESVRNTDGLPLGGFARERICKGEGDLEINGVRIVTGSSEGDIDLVSVDTLYCGTLADRYPEKILCASHTHFAPMLDARKPTIGKFVSASLDAYCDAIEGRKELHVSPDTIVEYRSNVASPIYRRFDVPASSFRQLVSRVGAMYPNTRCPISKSIDFFVFYDSSLPVFAICYHANHPVARFEQDRPSSDYIGALRQGVRQHFGNIPVIFLSGCSGDVRPNLTQKRFGWLPDIGFNRKFKSKISPSDQAAIDHDYREAALNASEVHRCKFVGDEVSLQSGTLRFRGYEDLPIPVLRFSRDLAFAFVPFEVSHLFNGSLPHGIRIVSCANDTRGYMPHPSQLSAGGYEVDGSRPTMGLPERVDIIDWEMP